MAQQTAVDWLLHQVDKYTSGGIQVPNDALLKLIRKAKKFERDQLVTAHYQGYRDSIGTTAVSERYYDETYKN